MLYENDFYIISEKIKQMSDKRIKEEALKAYAKIKAHPVIHKKSPLKNGLRFNFKTPKEPSNSKQISC